MLGSGCLPSMVPAPFPASAESTEPGSLLGPFDGRALDAQSGHPVAGALVWVTWRFCRGEVLCLPVASESWSGETDADGRYEVPHLRHFPGAVRLDRMTLVVYKRGYVGYRSDRLFEDAIPRRDFAQRRNEVKLEHFTQTQRHADHLAFLGGGGPLRASLRAEALQASLEGAATPTDSAPLDATTLLSIEELRQVTGSAEEFELERLEDLPRSAHYDSVHFRAATHGEASDAAIRVFVASSDAEAEQSFDALAAKLPNERALEPTPSGLGTRAAIGRDGDGEQTILGLLVLSRSNRVTVQVTCGIGLCRAGADIEALGRKIVARLPRLGRGAPPVAPAVNDTVEPKEPTEPSKPATPPADDHALKLREPGLHR